MPHMEVQLTPEQHQLLERAAQAQGTTVEALLEQATQEFLQARLGKQQGKTFFIRPKPICH